MGRAKQFFRALSFASLGLFTLAGNARAEEALQAKVYGFLNAQTERVWATGGATPYPSRFRISDGGSRLGFRGSYALSKSTKALWQIEAALQGFEQGGFNDQGSPIVITSRNTFIGIEDSHVGRLLVGNFDSAYRTLIGTGGPIGGNTGLTALGLDLWNNTDAQLSGYSKNIFSRGEARYPNSLHYFTPQLMLPVPFKSWLQFAASYSLDEAQSATGSQGRYSLSGVFKFGAFAVGAAYDRQANTGVDAESLQQGFGLNTRPINGPSTYFYKVVASFQPRTGSFIGFGFEQNNYGFVQFIPPTYTDYHAHLVSGHLRQTGVMASFAQSIGQATAMASIGALLNMSNPIYGADADYRARQYSIGVKYALSTTFGAYVFYTAIRNGPRQDVNLGTPIYSNNLGTAQAYMAPGVSPQVLGLGLIARF